MTQDRTSAHKALRIVIAGGSLGGVFAAVLLQRAGNDVRVFERSHAGLEGRGAGLVAQREIFEILRATGCEHVAHVGVLAMERITLDRSGGVIERHATPQMQISWDHLYRTVQGLLTEGSYVAGRSVAEIGQNDDAAWLALEDDERAEADLVIGADGVGSVTRKAVAGEDAAPGYAGYVAWRGLFPETLLDGDAAETLLDRFAFYHMPRSHILGYSVAGPGGEMEPGHRRYNWVWYRPVADLSDVLTDTDGRVHPFSLAPGTVPPSAREAMLADARALLPPQFLQAVQVEPQPFIQAIFDYEAPRMALGRIALLGDAAFVVRRHTAMGVAKAAGDAMALAALLGEHELGVALERYMEDRQEVGHAIAAYGRRLGAAFV
jgi:2-polyprenyl-6-methoxyphenol hydroxylase-like FAD-dependent oxidoreductase